MIFATAMTLWVRSYIVPDAFKRFNTQTEWGASNSSLMPVVKSAHLTYARAWTCKGAIAFASTRIESRHYIGTKSGWVFEHTDCDDPAQHSHLPIDRVHWEAAPFRLLYRVADTDFQLGSEFVLALPLWLFLIFGIPPLLWWRTWRKNRGRGFPVEADTPTSTPSQILQ